MILTGVWLNLRKRILATVKRRFIAKIYSIQYAIATLLAEITLELTDWFGLHTDNLFIFVNLILRKLVWWNFCFCFASALTASWKTSGVGFQTRCHNPEGVFCKLIKVTLISVISSSNPVSFFLFVMNYIHFMMMVQNMCSCHSFFFFLVFHISMELVLVTLKFNFLPLC